MFNTINTTPLPLSTLIKPARGYLNVCVCVCVCVCVRVCVCVSGRGDCSVVRAAIEVKKLQKSKNIKHKAKCAEF